MMNIIINTIMSFMQIKYDNKQSNCNRISKRAQVLKNKIKIQNIRKQNGYKQKVELV